MIGPRSGIGNAVSIQERTLSDPGENLESVVREEIEQIRPQQDLIEEMPEILGSSRTLAVMGPGRTGRTIAEVVPHRVVEETSRVVVDPPRLPLRCLSRHHRVKAVGTHQARLEGIHVEVADDHGATVTDPVLDSLDVPVDGRRRERLIFLRTEQLAAKMDGDHREVGSDDRAHALHGDAGVVSKGLDSTLWKACQHVQRPPDGRRGIVRGRVDLSRILVQPGYDVPYRIGCFGQDDDVRVPKAAEVSEQVDDGTVAGIPEENAHSEARG